MGYIRKVEALPLLLGHLINNLLQHKLHWKQEVDTSTSNLSLARFGSDVKLNTQIVNERRLTWVYK
jgi:hypothetical protein